MFLNYEITIVKCRWIHIIDSKSAHATPDEGSFSKLPNGDDLEIGSMPCPEKGGVVTPYEEVWRKIRPSPGSDLSWILQSVEDQKTFLGRVGGGFIVLRQRDAGFGARSEQWNDDEGKWVQKYAIGELDDCPSMVDGERRTLEGEGGWKIGDTVDILGKKYEVKAYERLT